MSKEKTGLPDPGMMMWESGIYYMADGGPSDPRYKSSA